MGAYALVRLLDGHASHFSEVGLADGFFTRPVLSAMRSQAQLRQAQLRAGMVKFGPFRFWAAGWPPVHRKAAAAATKNAKRGPLVGT